MASQKHNQRELIWEPKKKKKSMASGLSSPQALFLDTAAKEVCKVLSCIHTSMGPNHSKYWISLYLVLVKTTNRVPPLT